MAIAEQRGLREVDQDTEDLDSLRSYETFDDMELKQELHRGICSYGFERPSPIQQKAVMAIVTGRDTIAQSQSGTGKTAAFGIPLLQRLDMNIRKTQALVVTPTRELASQVKSVIEGLSCYMNTSVALCIGGLPVNVCIGDLKNNPHVVVGTPGRIRDMQLRGFLSNESIQMVVIDEADELLSKNFKDELCLIMTELQTTCQIVILSATLDEGVLELTEKFMRDPIRILVQKENLTLEGIKQYMVLLESDSQKDVVLRDLYKGYGVAMSIIFCATCMRVERVAKDLLKDGHSVTHIHSDMPQHQRDLAMSQYRKGTARIMVASELIARGIDVQQASVIINYDCPQAPELYIHRIGRAGRFGKKGVVITFVTKDDVFFIENVQKYYNTKIDDLPAAFDDLFADLPASEGEGKSG